jgi:hypothetical protein
MVSVRPAYSFEGPSQPRAFHSAAKRKPSAVCVSFLQCCILQQTTFAFCTGSSHAPRENSGSDRLLANPIRTNDLEARRRRLRLSPAALGRILCVDPATMFRHERGSVVALWDYAMRGTEAEASASGVHILWGYKSRLDQETFMAQQLDARGYSYLREKMTKRCFEHAQKILHPPRSRPQDRHDLHHRAQGTGLSKGQIKQIADRAERPKG